MNLKPCPFCGGKAVSYSRKYEQAIECMSCAARGPLSESVILSIDRWNERTPDQPTVRLNTESES